MLFASHELYLRRCVIAALKTKFAEGGCGMAHSTKTVEKFPEPGSELAISVGAIAEKLLQSIRDKGDRVDADQRGLLERAPRGDRGRTEPAHRSVENSQANQRDDRADESAGFRPLAGVRLGQRPVLGGMPRTHYDQPRRFQNHP